MSGTQTVPTPFGFPLRIRASNLGIEAVQLVVRKPRTPDRPNQHTRAAARQLREYIAGQRKVFTVKLADHTDATAYRRSVWTHLQSIGYGCTCSYSDLAQRAGGNSRTAGTANGANPCCVLIPCHRVLRKDGTLGGYGGTLGPANGARLQQRLLAFKQSLLEHEARVAGKSADS